MMEYDNARDILRAVRDDARHRTARRFFRRFCDVAVIVGLVNFLLFLAGAFYFGGDAWNGKAEAGRYFLWGYHNGTKGYIEVTKAVFDYSKWHVYTVMVTWPLMLLAGFASSRIKRRSHG